MRKRKVLEFRRDYDIYKLIIVGPCHCVGDGNARTVWQVSTATFTFLGMQGEPRIRTRGTSKVFRYAKT